MRLITIASIANANCARPNGETAGQAKLQALQMQLNPHFLFNTLHSISSLMHKDVEAADKMITRLSDLLRAALAGADTQEVHAPSRAQFASALPVDRTDRLATGSRKMEIAPDTLEAQVPILSCSRWWKNAIRHGIEPRARPGRIELRSQREESRLALVVSDDGAGVSGNGAVQGRGRFVEHEGALARTLRGDSQFRTCPRPAAGCASK